MIETEYTVVFTNHCFENVTAFGVKQAAILAQAEQIKKGHSFNIELIKDEHGKIYREGWS
jgi:hypothetical protein